MIDVLRTLEEQVDPAHTALIVVDMQNDFLEDDGFLGKVGADVATGRQLLPAINQFIDDCRRLGTKVIFLQEVFTERTSQPNLIAQWGGWDLVIAEGSWGVEFSSELTRALPDEPVVVKHNYDGFSGTPLRLILDSMGIRTLLFCGVSTNICVETTARHGYIDGFYIVTLGDLCAASDVAEHEAALHNLGSYFGKVTTADEVRAVWARRTARADLVAT
jgi:ureidoacrylate peracid hydrolase